MKTIIILCFTCICSFMLSSCFNDNFETQSSKYSGAKKQIEGNVFIDDFNLPEATGSENRDLISTMNGNGVSNLVNIWEYYMENTHNATYDKFGDEIFLNNGEFRIESEDGENAIFGTYQGWGLFRNEIFNADLVFDIKGGEGFYKGASGGFNAFVKNNSTYPVTLNMEFNGVIYY